MNRYSPLRRLTPLKSSCAVTDCHEYTPENTRLNARGYRNCRACAREYARHAKARARAS